MSAPAPPTVTDPERLAALAALAVLDTPAEEGFDDVVHLATQICAAPVALVSLVDRDRQWFKARVGFAHAQTDLDRSVCKFVLDEPDLLVIPDLAADPRTADNPLVTGEPGIRFYAGAPLRAPEGQVLGSLCVIDHEPRPGGLAPPQAEGLRRLARQVSRQLELRRAVLARDALLAEQRTVARERTVFRATQAAIAAAGGDLGTVLDTLVAGVMEVVPAAEGGALELVDGDALEYRAVRGSLSRHRGLRVPLEGSTSGACFRTGAPILIGDARRDERVDQARREAIGLASAIHVPVTRGEAVLGVLKLQSSRVGAFSQHDLGLAQLFAGAATAGLTGVAEADAERARRRGERRLRLLARISAALLTTSDPGRAIEPILAAGAESLGFDQSYLYDVAPDGRHLRLTHAVGASEEVRAALAHVGIESPLCGIVAATRQPVVLQGVQATSEVRYALARATGIDAFAGYPVTSRGALVGVVSFCSATEPAFDAEALTFFETVARYLSGVRERLDGEAALRESDDRSRRAQAAGRVGTFEVDVASGLMSVSPEFARLYGRPPTGLYTPEAFEALVLPEDRGLVSSEASREAGTAPPEVEYRVRRADDGAVRWIARRASFARDEAGRVTGMFGTVQDVTEQRETRDELAHVGERLRLAIDATRIGIFDYDLVTGELAWDARVRELFGVPAETPVTYEGAFLPGVHPEDRAAADDAVRSALDPTGPGLFDVEYRVRPRDGGEERWLAARGRAVVRDGRALRFIGTVRDVTPRRRAIAALHLAEHRQAALVELGDRLHDLDDVPALVRAAAEIMARVTGAAQAGYGVVDAARETVEVLTDWGAPGVASVAGRHGIRAYGSYVENLKRGEVVAVDDVALDPRTRDRADALLGIGVRAFLNVPVVERGELVGIAFVHYPRPRTLGGDDLAFVRAVGDRVQNAVARVRAEAEQRVLNEELSHRLKNTLAMVISIAHQTLRGVPDRAPVEAFERRLHALSSAHDVLLRQTWSAAPLDAVARAVIGNVAQAGRVSVSGPEIALGPRATLSLSLLLHELATNAAKYGALSNEVGRVDLRWRFDGAEDEADVVLDWEEKDGPPVREPTGKGFGSRLIRLGLVGTGGVELRYPASGFRAEMRAPLAQLRQS